MTEHKRLTARTDHQPAPRSLEPAGHEPEPSFAIWESDAVHITLIMHSILQPPHLHGTDTCRVHTWMQLS